RTRRNLLETRTESRRGKIRLRIDNKRTYAIPDEDREMVEDVIARFATEQPDTDHFRVLDVAGRIAGTGSLGIPRFVVLVHGPGRRWRQRLLDVKQARPTTLPRSFETHRIGQPKWPNEATRIVEIQRRMQAVPPALLHPVSTGDRSFVVRELQPQDDRLTLESTGGRVARLRRVATTMGQLTAWAQLRSAGRDRSANADELIEFAHAIPRQQLLAFARKYAKQVRRDWSEFRESVAGE